MKNSQKYLSLAAALALVGGGLAGCAQNKADDTPKKDKPPASDKMEKDGKKDAEPKAEEEEKGAVAANKRPDECGLQEQAGPAGDFGPFTGEIHYFQPGEMMANPANTMQMRKYADSQMHLELDFKANEYATNWGYSVDETPANLPIVYKLTDKDGKELSHGAMTAMNAIDGSHYGTNLPKDTIKEPGAYKMTITVYPPKNYDFHNDYITGVPAREVWKPLTVTMDWNITKENLEAVKANTVADPMAVPDKCKQYPVKMFEDAAAKKAMEAAESAQPLPMDLMKMDHM